MKNLTVKLAALLCAAAMTVSCAAGKGADKSKTLLTVGDYSITENGFKYFYNEYKKQTADSEGTKELTLGVLEKNLKYAEAAKLLGTEPSENDVNKMRDMMVKNAGGEDAYNKELKDNGVNDEFFINAVITPNLAYSKLSDKVDKSITDEQRKEYFDKNYIRAKNILILTMDETTMETLDDEAVAEAEKTAEEVYNKAIAGEDFDALLDAYNQDPGAQTNPDGYVFTEGDMVQSFYDAAKSLENNGITMVQSTYGYHIIKRLALDGNQTLYNKSLSDSKSSIDSKIIQQRVLELADKAMEEKGVKTELNEELYNGIE